MQEHENALRFFQRALQVAPGFTYAYTLAGHEYAAAEDFEKALTCYQHAVRLDPRHYNAWCVSFTLHSMHFSIKAWRERREGSSTCDQLAWRLEPSLRNAWWRTYPAENCYMR